MIRCDCDLLHSKLRLSDIEFGIRIYIYIYLRIHLSSSILTINIHENIVPSKLRTLFNKRIMSESYKKKVVLSIESI